MAHELRIKIAALATVGFLAVISAAGLGLRHEPTQPHAHVQVMGGEHEPEED